MDLIRILDLMARRQMIVVPGINRSVPLCGTIA